MSAFDPVGYFQSINGKINFIELPVNYYVHIEEDALLVSDSVIGVNVLLPADKIVLMKGCQINSDVIIEIPKGTYLTLVGCTLNQNCQFILLDKTSAFSLNDSFLSKKITLTGLANIFNTNAYIVIISENSGYFSIGGQIITDPETNPGIYSGSRGDINIEGNFNGVYLTDNQDNILSNYILIGLIKNKNTSILPPVNINYLVEIITE